MLTEFHGGFILRNQGYGILSSTYFNHIAKKPHPETAILTSGKNDDDPYLGIFKTVWWEATGKPYEAKLTIILNAEGTYDLEWTDKTGTIWKGLGIIENKNLVGCYWPVGANAG